MEPSNFFILSSLRFVSAMSHPDLFLRRPGILGCRQETAQRIGSGTGGGAENVLERMHGQTAIESGSERTPRGFPRGKRAN